MNPLKTLGKQVKKGDTLGIIGNPLGVQEYKVYAPAPGIIIGKSNLPLVHEGAALFHIACVKELSSEAKKQVGIIEEQYSDDFTLSKLTGD
jgi:predicted deacylase